MSQEEAGSRLRFSDKKISRIEQGQLPGYHELRAMLDTYALTVDQWDPIITLYDRAGEKGWWHAYGIDDRGFVSVEAEACQVDTYQLGYVPGLLQTGAYVRAVHTGARHPMEGKDLENGVAIRKRRQQRLIDEPSFRLHVIMDESVLTRPVCGRIDQRDQLEHIIRYAELPNVIVQLVPFSVGAYSGQNGNFSVLHFSDPEEPDLAYVEHVFASFYLEKPTQVCAVRLTFDYLADLALDEEDSLALIKRVLCDL